MASAEAEAIKAEFVAFSEALQTDPPPELQEMRDAYATLGNIGTKPDGVTWTDVDVDGISAIWAEPDGGVTDRALLYVHGGGYVIGAAEYYRNMCGHLAKAIGCRVLILDYRLAPEHPHPAPVEDGVRGFQWLRSQGFDTNHIAIAGDSAGGGLTITTMLSLRDQGLGQPAAGVPISPWGDLEGLGGSIATNADKDVLVSIEMLQAMAMMFLAGGDERTRSRLRSTPTMPGSLRCTSKWVATRRCSTTPRGSSPRRRKRASMSPARCSRRCSTCSSSERVACPRPTTQWPRSAPTCVHAWASDLIAPRQARQPTAVVTSSRCRLGLTPRCVFEHRAQRVRAAVADLLRDRADRMFREPAVLDPSLQPNSALAAGR